MPLQQCLTLSSDPCSLTLFCCVFSGYHQKEEFADISLLTFPISFKKIEKSFLGASSILKHYFKPVIASVWSLTAPKSCTQNDNHCISACISYYSQVPTGKILSVCQENTSRLYFLWKSASESSGGTVKKAEIALKVFCSGTCVCQTSDISWHDQTVPGSGQTNQYARVWL